MTISANTRQKSVENVRRLIRDHEIQRRELERAQWDDMEPCVVLPEPAPEKKSKPAALKVVRPGYSLWYRCKSRAAKKGMAFDLREKDCVDLAPCAYCGGKSTGFDRVDSECGYTRRNTVPACGRCNTMKNDMSVDAWMDHMRRILQFHQI